MRIKRGVNAHKKRIKVFKSAKGYRGSKSKLYTLAKQQLMKSGQYAYVGRKNKKRDFRTLWIARINAEARVYGLSYSNFMNGVKKAGIELNRKSLSELAINDKAAFAAIAEQAKKALEK